MISNSQPAVADIPPDLEYLKLRGELARLRIQLKSSQAVSRELTQALQSLDILISRRSAPASVGEPLSQVAFDPLAAQTSVNLLACLDYVKKWRAELNKHNQNPLHAPAAFSLVRRKRSAAAEISESGLFDPIFYRSQGPEGETADLIQHYISVGAAGELDPNPLFQSGYYLRTYKDVAAAHENPLVHYICHGEKEGRRPNLLFDPIWYLRINPDVEAANASPLKHYLEFGCLEGRDPHPLFWNDWYWSQEGASTSILSNPFAHYIRMGASIGLDPHPLFETDFYFGNDAPVRRVRENPLAHYMEFGASEGRSPHPYFDAEFYQTKNPDVHDNPLIHYLYHGGFEGRDPSSIFNNRRHMDRQQGTKKINPLLAFVLATRSAQTRRQSQS